ncbi:conserved hypothetical protein [Kribbella flavida DSM 17836]|uniref:Cytochrome c oxidase caa3-type, assembly factor CtaG-related protein n=1 Tax=Kribbella flavida (strain DSM 17836 / JCM 10339 / NBRC 14399) TaxID=479435 RepID=D2PYE6_KRIFD|nr:cytochrome c oxidase assembly protein [Kribbella flavida]ADB35514.1 conserved hypothetical protein [Kribbella flavida DSM 17836]
MTHSHDHQATGLATFAALLTALVLVIVYAWAVQRLQRRGDTWSVGRFLCFAGGVLGLTAAFALPLPGRAFTAHMTQHLLIGMLAPLLIVLARPLTLALRVLRPGRARQSLLALAHSRWSSFVQLLPVVAVLEVGGLWALYRTPLFAASQERPWLHAVVHGHVIVSGLLFAFVICQLDPVRRRYGLVPRAATVVLAGAAHAVLAKSLYASPPPGTTFAAADLAVGAKVMYYGGDVVEILLAVVLALQWYSAEGRRFTRGLRPGTSSGRALGRLGRASR